MKQPRFRRNHSKVLESGNNPAMPSLLGVPCDGPPPKVKTQLDLGVPMWGLHDTTGTRRAGARYEAGQARIREQNARLRGGGDLPGVDHDP